MTPATGSDESAVGPAGPGSASGLMQIGEVAGRVDLSLRTVRHYEEVGLVPVADRSPGGFRLYTEAAVERLLVIKQMKPLDFTLEEMREVLDALDEIDAGGLHPTRCEELRLLLARYEQATAKRLVKLQEWLDNGKEFRAALASLGASL